MFIIPIDSIHVRGAYQDTFDEGGDLRLGHIDQLFQVAKGGLNMHLGEELGGKGVECTLVQALGSQTQRRSIFLVQI